MKRVLFDQNTPRKLRRFLAQHKVSTAYEMRWDQLVNGELLRIAEEGGFEVFLTADQSIRYQQNLVTRHIAILELSTNNWPRILRHTVRIADVIDRIGVGDYVQVLCD